ncbi:MAG: hypothetical protein P4L63_01655 [Candidatus Pacebacteria bacterium]|nr:hypothetical protein [Candidatus Paceibacterota bacterium]
MKKKLLVLAGIMGTPFLALANNCTAVGTTATQNVTFEQMLCTIGNILDFVIPILITLGVVYFVWGVVSYVIASDEEAKSAGRNRMIFGIIGLTVIVGVWGLVTILGNTFGTNGAVTVSLPTVVIPAQQ